MATTPRGPRLAMSVGVRLRSSISFICRVLTVWLAIHAVPAVHAQDGAGSLPPPSAARRRFPPLQPTAAGREQTAGDAPRLRSPNKHERAKDLLIAGAVIFSIAYSLTTTLAAIDVVAEGAYDSKNIVSCSVCGTAFRLFIPVGGPWFVFSEATDNGGRAMLGILGATEALGFLLTLIGGIVYSATGDQPAATRPRDGLTFAAVPTRDGALLALRFAL